MKGVLKKYRYPIGGVVAVLVMLGAMLAYSGMWPPVFVVESASMQHSDTESKLGIIDTGDLVIVQASDGGGVRTYVESFNDGDRTFGDYGDVVIYERYGRSDSTPIIHRAMLRLVYNATGESYDVPSLAALPSDKWGNGDLPDGRWWDLDGTVELFDVGYRSVTVRVDLAGLLNYFENLGAEPHGGLITMGDHNVNFVEGEWLGIYDQSSAAICREPIKDEWVVGEAKVEIPWLGLIKLFVNGNMPPNTPENSKTSLVVLLAFLIVTPLALDVSTTLLRRRGIDPWEKLRERLGRLRRKKE